MAVQQASKIYKTKRYNRDTDQVLNDDLRSVASVKALENQSFDEYLPGLAQHYCVPCAKYFETDVALKSHKTKKVHKRQLRNLRFGPYTHEEASAGAGRDVHKYLAKQKDQERIQQEQADQITSKPKEHHKKAAKRTLVAPVEMEIEETTVTVPAAAEAEEEITV